MGCEHWTGKQKVGFSKTQFPRAGLAESVLEHRNQILFPACLYPWNRAFKTVFNECMNE